MITASTPTAGDMWVLKQPTRHGRPGRRYVAHLVAVESTGYVRGTVRPQIQQPGGGWVDETGRGCVRRPFVIRTAWLLRRYTRLKAAR